MLEQYFMPLHRHFDGGFHATGDAFKSAAEKLSTEPDRLEVAMNSHLPINYLYRHAIELYLKSMIIILTRVMERSQSPLDPTTVKVQVAKDKPLTSVHSLKVLLDETQRLVTSHSVEIALLTPTDWSVPAELSAWVDTIEKHDGSSTFSRYPTSKSTLDSTKSSFQTLDVEEMAKKMQEQKPGEKGQLLLLMQNDDDEIVEAFGLREEILPELRTALVEASKLLSGSAFGLQMELVDGYGKKLHKRVSKARQVASDPVSAEDSVEEHEEPEPNYNHFFEHLGPRIGEIARSARTMLGGDPVLVCCDAAKINNAHPVVLDLFHKHGRTRVNQLSETLFCLPVSNAQLREALEEYPEEPLDEVVERTATGIWVVCFEDNGLAMLRIKESAVAE